MRVYLPFLRKQQKGFTLIEVLVATAIIAIAGAALITTISFVLKVTLLSQDTTRAQTLANEKMEVIKNLPYNSLATQHGAVYPPGNIPDSETVTSGSQTYVVHTYISYVDDPFDGNAEGTIPGKPVDKYPFDYKNATIEVRNKADTKVLAKISTNISSNAAETSNGTGILFLNVTNSVGNPVPNANVHLTNPTKTPPVDITTITDTKGLLQIPLLPEDQNKGYYIQASFPGDSTDQAYFSIIAQQVTSVSLKIDLVSTMNVAVTNETGTPFANLAVTVTGDTNGYSSTFTTDANGLITISNLGFDSYSFSVPANRYIISTSPYHDVSVPAGATINVALGVTTNSNWPRIDAVSPISGLNNNTAVKVTVTGTNLPGSSTMQLRQSGQSPISATGVTSKTGGTKLTGTFNLNGAAAGIWDLVITTSVGSTTQTGGFTISAP